MKRRPALILTTLVVILIFSNIFILKIIVKPNRSSLIIQRVIDGDTFETSTGETVRLANINSPEKGEKGYEEAKNFLKQFENKTVQAEFLGTDKYQRTLARVYSDSYLNLEIVQEGLATKFLVDKLELNLFDEAEFLAVKKQNGLWKESPFVQCVFATIDAESELIFLENSCAEIKLDGWSIRDESRKRFKLPNISANRITIHTFEGKNNETDIFLNQKQSIWNNDRDTFYLLDANDFLVIHNSYGY